MSIQNAPFSTVFFPGFFPALQACHLERQPCVTAGTGGHGSPFLNIPVLRSGTNELYKEIVKAEEQITSTINCQQNYDNKVRSKRYSRRKRRRRQAARNAQAALQEMVAARREPGEASDESAAEGDMSASFEQDRLR